MKKIILALALMLSVAAQAQLSLENIWNSREFTPKFIPGFNSMSDGKTYCQLETNPDKSRSCNKYDFKSGDKLNTIFNTDKIMVDSAPIVIESYSFSHDESKVLITNGFVPVYRHSGMSNAYVYDLKSGQLSKISNKKIMYATLSPDGSKVAYVSDNNLFYYDLKKKKDVQVTKDGEKNHIINGAVDWVYEEEFSMSRGFEWSPDGQFIAYYKFDESAVPFYSMDIYGKLYPEHETWKYPKAGEPNSKVDVYIHKLGSKKNVLCETGSQNDQYLPRIKWMSTNYLSVQRLNRLQNTLEVLRFSYYYSKPQVIYSETNQWYIEIEDWSYFSDSSMPIAIFSSEKSGYKHLYSMNAKYEVKQITSGNWEVDVFYGSNGQLAYFSSGKDNPGERQLYSVNLMNGEIKQLTKDAGWHSVSFSSTFEYFLDNFSSMTSPSTFTIRDASGQSVRVLEDNAQLKQKLTALNLGQVEFGSFTSDKGVKLDYWKINPPNFDSSRHYPVLFYVYGGPGYQTVKNQWQGANYMWYQYMAAKGYVIISIDNRGSGARGEQFKKMTYLNLGKYETEDYISAAVHFGAQTWADKSRIGVFGWSYGGFMASNCITKGADVFKAAVAVAPVTNWRFYDNIYTERYMRTPQENAAGYDQNSPLTHVGLIKGHYLIIHGTADDNVHFQNAAEMVKAMNDMNIPYDAEYYPNKNHGIGGGKTRLHLFTKITNYLLENL